VSVEPYFRQCSVLVSAVDLAVMGATLANGGVNPRTGAVAMDQEIAERVLTVMATCGMYDFSGEWLFRVGLPAKSGVSGGLVAVSPSQFGIGMHSPRLDSRGNSVRGVEASRAISERFSLHVMHQVARSGPSFVRVTADGSERPVGPPPEGSGPDDDVRLLSMQGYIEFATAEQALLIVRLHVDDTDAPSAVVVELDHVTGCHPVAAVLLDATIDEVMRHGITVVTVDRSGRRLVHGAAEFSTRDEALAYLTGGAAS
jgi:glutaminase